MFPLISSILPAKNKKMALWKIKEKDTQLWGNSCKQYDRPYVDPLYPSHIIHPKPSLLG